MLHERISSTETAISKLSEKLQKVFVCNFCYLTSIRVKESLEDLAERLRQAEIPKAKERLQVLYWLKQEDEPSISAIANSLGKHRGTVQS